MIVEGREISWRTLQRLADEQADLGEQIVSAAGPGWRVMLALAPDFRTWNFTVSDGVAYARCPLTAESTGDVGLVDHAVRACKRLVRHLSPDAPR